MKTNIMYLIVASDVHVAHRFAEANNIKVHQWLYAKSQKDFYDGPTIILLNSWKKKRCILLQTLLKTAIAWGNNPVVYMAEDERLSDYL